MRLSDTLRLLDYLDAVTPGDVYLFTTNGPSLKSHSRRNRLNAGPGETGGRALKRSWNQKNSRCGETVASTSVILLNVSFWQLKLNIKYYRILPSVWYFSTNRGGGERWNDTPLCGKMKWWRNWPTRRPACRQAMMAAKIPARSSGRVFRVRKPKMEEPAPAPTPEKENVHTCWYSTCFGCYFVTCMCVRVSPATSRLHNNSHFEYPMKYMKLPEYKYKLKSLSQTASPMCNKCLTCPISFSVMQFFCN